ncbi:AAA family ATPase [Falsibacillus pallidus]|uniref:Putative ATPase n=1 Tax=Falsibacillus pallidus TaxID=493781 RepID=A0A370GQD8_9BACI|nr:AAA family ATPase [Falsibacillus pallidus]RDI45456.1 putative ATPase [Falsibacillus pallidus]
MKLYPESPFLRYVELKKELVPSFAEFPFNLPSIQKMDRLNFHPNTTFIIGENGLGKSTLLEAIAVCAGFNPEGGTFNFQFSTYDSHSELDQYMRLVRGTEKPKNGFFLRAETFYNVASQIEKLDQDPLAGRRIIDSFGGKSLHEQSHGESFFAAFTNRFGPEGLYILDEPEAALSPLRQLSLLSRMHELIQEGSQFIIATHSPILMSYPGAKIMEMSPGGMKETELEETSHYTIMEQFFLDRKRLLHHLLNKS